MNILNIKLYILLPFLLTVTFCSKKDIVIENYENSNNYKRYIDMTNKIITLENEYTTIRYFYNKQIINNQQFNNYSLSSFNLDFINEVSEKKLEKERDYFRVYYKDNNVIKYELYSNIPSCVPVFDYVHVCDHNENIIHNNEVYFNTQAELSKINYYIYNENNQIVSIIEKNKYRITVIIIDYISDELALFETLVNGEIIDEGKLFFNEENKIIRHRSTFNRFKSP